MIQFELNGLGVQEIDSLKTHEIQGGKWFIGPAVMFSIYLFDNRDRFVEGIKDGIRDFY